MQVLKELLLCRHTERRRRLLCTLACALPQSGSCSSSCKNTRSKVLCAAEWWPTCTAFRAITFS